MRKPSLNRGRPHARRIAERPLRALDEMWRRYDGIDDLLAKVLSGELTTIEFMDELDAITSNIDVNDVFTPPTGNPLPAEDAVRLANVLHRIDVVRGALSAHEARLIEIENSVTHALIGVDIERRLVPAYMAEFAARLQTHGVVRKHVRDLADAKMKKIVAILTDEEKSDPDDPPARDIEPEVSAAPPWDVLDLYDSPYDVIARMPADAVEEAINRIKLPPVATPRELGVNNGKFATILRNIEEHGAFALFLGYLLPEWERRVGITLTDQERRTWAFLMVIVDQPETARREDPKNSFAGLLFPGPTGSSTIREVVLR